MKTENTHQYHNPQNIESPGEGWKTHRNDHWYAALFVNCVEVCLMGIGHIRFEKLMEEEWDVKRPGSEWGPCYKWEEA